MLVHMQISNFAIVKTLELDFQRGMTTITGETGAGKSIAIDALGLCLGDRADAAMVRTNEEKAEIIVEFSLANNPTARAWLSENELLDGEDCILRRIITKEGRSRAYINGTNVPISQQKTLGQYLINIHGQHAHQLLMRSEHQLRLLDQYAGHHALLEKMKTSFESWRNKALELKESEKNKEALEARKQLLEYQVKELNELNLAENEFDELEQEHKRLSNCGDIATTSQAVMEALSDNEDSNALELLKFAKYKLNELSQFDSEFVEMATMIDEAFIQIQEASYSINSYVDRLEMDPARLSFLDERLSAILRLARKHQVSPALLFQAHQELAKELSQLTDSDNQMQALTEALEKLRQEALINAQKLSESRVKFAGELNKLITQSMHQLSMPHGQFYINVKTDSKNTPSALGTDQIDFQVSTNPDQPLQSLGKVASGGELSRISLAIQVIAAQKVDTPSLIFDEVDVGISGATAMIVGKLLRQLGDSTQVLCVTHLPQVAGCGHQQMFVNKISDQGSTTTNMILLSQDERIHELARLLGGSEITAHTLANAKELIIAA